MKRRMTFKQTMVRNFLFSYLFILLLPMMALRIAHNQAIQAIGDNAINAQLSLLRQADQALKTNIEEAQKTAMLISADEVLNNYLYQSISEDKSLSAYAIWDIQRLLEKQLSTKQYLCQIYLCLRQSETVISASNYYQSQTVGSKLKIENLLSEDDIFGYNLGSIERMLVRDEKLDCETLVFVKSFVNGVTNEYYGNILLVFDAKKIGGLMSFDPGMQHGYNAVLGPQGEVLLGVGDGRNWDDAIYRELLQNEQSQGNLILELEQKRLYLTYLRSQPYDWELVAVYPEDVLMEQALSLRKMMNLYIVATIALGLLAATAFTLWHTWPIQRVLQILDRSAHSSIREYRSLPDVIGELMDSYALLQNEQAEHRTIRENALLSQLLQGGPEVAAVSVQLTRELSISKDQLACAGVFFCFGHSPHSLTASIHFELLRKGIGRQLGSIRYFVQQDDGGLLVLLCFNVHKPPVLSTLVSSITDYTKELLVEAEMEQQLQEMHFAAGISCVTDPEQAHDCAYQAKFAAEYARLFEIRTPVAYPSQNGCNGLQAFSLEDHQKMLNILKTGDCDAAQAYFNELISHHLIIERLDINRAEQLFYGVKSVITEALQYINMMDITQEVNDMPFRRTDFVKSFLNLEETYIRMTKAISDKRTEQRNSLTGEVLQHLGKNYGDTNLSLTSVADYFSVSESYLSKVLRLHTNQTFASHLERIRMERAVELLKSGTTSVSDIAGKVGYNSVESFRRAFKRVMGVSPSLYCQPE